MSAADIANRHFTAALTDAKAEGVDADALCRSLLGLVVSTIWKRGAWPMCSRSYAFSPTTAIPTRTSPSCVRSKGRYRNSGARRASCRGFPGLSSLFC
jgi:hypothetical protein